MEIRFTNNESDDLIEKIVELGTRNSKTLGHFPRGAFFEHARQGFILIAVDDDELAGYLLFRIAQKKQIVSITQLCISERFRGTGLGIEILEFLAGSFKTKFRGIALRCREDYIEASKLWESFGFKAKDKVRGRGKKETTLVKWWYDFGNPDLFSELSYDTDRLRVVIDANIIIKLREIDTETDTEVKSLDADWIYDSVDFYFAPETYNEINRDKDRVRASETREFLKNFSEIRFRPEKRNLFEKELRKLIKDSSVNNKSDRLQLAECIASSFDYFITQDEDVLSKAEDIYNLYGVNIYRPSDLIIYLDKLKNFDDYASLRVEGANYDISRIGEKEIDSVIEEFLLTSWSERKIDLKTQLLSLVSNVKAAKVQLIKDGDQKLGVLGFIERNGSIEIQILRTNINHGLSNVLFQQLLVEVFRNALTQKVNSITVTESFLNDHEKNILEDLGFILSNGIWKKLMLQGSLAIEKIFDNALVRNSFNIPEIRKRIRISSEDERNLIIWELEKKLWPVKIKDLEIPTYIIPIKPTWAKDLFDFKLATENLFGANANLIWSNENIYYRSVRPVSEKAPARILWYLSSGANKYTNRKSGIIACSYLMEVNIDTAKKLFQKFKNYGVYDWKSIYKLANENPDALIKALKFSFTEVFNRIIKKDVIDEIFIEHDQKKNTFASPLKIKNAIFEYMYNIGVNNE